MFMMIIMTRMCFCYPQIIVSLLFSLAPKKRNFTTNLHHEFLENMQKLLFFLITFIIHTTHKKSDDDDDVCISIDALSNRWDW